MTARAFNDPKITLNRVYTKQGDDGETNLANGRRVPKDDLRIETYGTVDEVNSHVGLARVLAKELATDFAALQRLTDILLRIQHELFNLGSILATDPEEVCATQPQITNADVAQLEGEIDEMNMDLEPLRSFVLPGGNLLNTELHVCRTICRRSERLCAKLCQKEKVPPVVLTYLNRLSDAFFVWSRWVCLQTSDTEVLWEPNKSASGTNRSAT